MAANPELRTQLEQAIEQNPVLLLMKGTPDAPQCGFSMRTVNVLEQVGVEYGAIDVLPILGPLRDVTTEISDWNTFPQLYAAGELVGGCDIVEEMFEAGELAELLGVEPQARTSEAAPSAEADVRPATEDGPYQSPPMQIET